MPDQATPQPQNTQQLDVLLPEDTDQTQAQDQSQNQADPKSKRGRGVLVVLLVLAMLVGGAAAFLLMFPPYFDVTINGATVQVKRGTTLEQIIAEGMAQPVPGDLLALDGSIATQGGGKPFDATVDGRETSDPKTKLTKDAVVEIRDGSDTTESYQESEEDVPAPMAAYDADPSAYYGGAIHVFTHGSGGRAIMHTGDVSGVRVVERYTVPPVESTYRTYDAYVGYDRAIALTFDDGPWGETTDEILSILEAYDAKATFFTIGSQIEWNADIVKRAHEIGCQICTHTWDHASGSGGGVDITSMSEQEQIDEVLRGFEAIKNVTGVEPSHVMRAPGGNFYGDSIRILEPYIDAEIGWNVDTRDWAQPGAKAIYEAIMTVRPGGVILMHDGGGDRSQTVAAVRKAVPQLVALGYKLVTIDELMAYGEAPTEGAVVDEGAAYGVWGYEPWPEPPAPKKDEEKEDKDKEGETAEGEEQAADESTEESADEETASDEEYTDEYTDEYVDSEESYEDATWDEEA